MLFITNRRFIEGSRSQAGRLVEFDLVDNEPSASVFFCERHDATCYQELTAKPFFERLRRSPRQQILLYIHGYNSLPEQVLASGRALQAGCDTLQPGLVEVVPVIWPCDSDLGILRDYWDDQFAAEHSAIAFSRAMHHFVSWRDTRAVQAPAEPCLKHVNVLAHSMGNRVLAYTMRHWASEVGEQAIFRNLFLVAADIPNESLEPDGIGRILPRLTRNLAVYHAGDDFALRTSKVVNLRNRVLSRRLGHTGPENPELTPRNVYVLDCGEFNNHYDRMGHTYFHHAPDGRPGLALRHMMDAMRSGRIGAMEPGAREALLDDAPPMVDTRQWLAWP